RASSASLRSALTVAARVLSVRLASTSMRISRSSPTATGGSRAPMAGRPGPRPDRRPSSLVIDVLLIGDDDGDNPSAVDLARRHLAGGGPALHRAHRDAEHLGRLAGVDLDALRLGQHGLNL